MPMTVDIEIGARRFVHGSIPYEFTYKQILDKCLESKPVRRLKRYMELVEQGTFPNALFNDARVPRASKMRIRGLEKGQKSFLQQYMVDTGLVTRLGPGTSPLPAMVQAVFKNFKEMAIGKNPAHEPVLKSLLLRHPDSVAIELPVWRVAARRNECLTGHVDLLQVGSLDDGRVEIRVMDYKPEGENKFILFLPQIVLYATLLREKIDPDGEAMLSCIIFDKKVAWQFSHDILHRVDGKIARYNVARDWNPFLGKAGTGM